MTLIALMEGALRYSLSGADNARGVGHMLDSAPGPDREGKRPFDPSGERVISAPRCQESDSGVALPDTQ